MVIAAVFYESESFEIFFISTQKSDGNKKLIVCIMHKTKDNIAQVFEKRKVRLRFMKSMKRQQLWRKSKLSLKRNAPFGSVGPEILSLALFKDKYRYRM